MVPAAGPRPRSLRRPRRPTRIVAAVVALMGVVGVEVAVVARAQAAMAPAGATTDLAPSSAMIAIETLTRALLGVDFATRNQTSLVLRLP